MNYVSHRTIISLLVTLIFNIESCQSPQCPSLVMLAAKKTVEQWPNYKIFTSDMIQTLNAWRMRSEDIDSAFRHALVAIANAQKPSVDKVPAMQLLCALPLAGKFSPDGSMIAYNHQGELHLHDAYAGNHIFTLKHGNNVAERNYFCWSPQGRYINMWHRVLFDVKNKLVRVFQNKVSRVRFTADEKYLLLDVHTAQTGHVTAVAKYPYDQSPRMLRHVFNAEDPQSKWLGVTLGIDEQRDVWSEIESFKTVMVGQHFLSSYYNFSPDGELFSRLWRNFHEDDNAREYTAWWRLINRKTGTCIELPLPTWDWDYDSSSIHVNKENTRILLYECEWQESIVVDIAQRKIIYEEHLHTDGNSPERKKMHHIYSRDLSKVVYFKPTPAGGTRVEVKNFNGAVLHAWDFDIPLQHAHHAVDEDYLALIYEDRQDCHLLKILVNITTGQVLCRDEHTEGYNLGYEPSTSFSSDGKYLSVDPSAERVSIWQLPLPLNAKKHSLAEIMAYRVLENNRLADEKPSDAAQKMLLQSKHKELRTFARILRDKKQLQQGIHRRAHSLS